MKDLLLTARRYIFISDVCVAFLFGLELCLASITLLLLKRDKVRTQKRNRIFIGYIVVILVLQTLSFVSLILKSEEFLVESTIMFSESEKSWWNVAQPVTMILIEWLEGLLLIYRCYIICDSNPRIIILPIILFLTATAFGLVAVIQSKGTTAYLSSIYLHICIPITAALLILITTLVSFRIFSVRRELLRSGGTHTLLQIDYAGLVAIAIETALPFSLLSILVSVALIKNWTSLAVLCGIWEVYAGIAPILIIYRIAKGTAWSSDSDGDDWSNGADGIRFTMQTISVGDQVPEASQAGIDVRC